VEVAVVGASGCWAEDGVAPAPQRTSTAIARARVGERNERAIKRYLLL